jgi:subtilisin family serine protease
MVAGLIRLVAPTARIMPLKAFTPLGTASLFNLTRAVYYAADNGAKVINMSFTIAQTSDEFTRAINYAAARGVICIGAAGNSGRQTVVFPAAYHNVLGVASTTNADQRSTFSNFGAALVSLAAPGEGLITAYPGGGYASVWGTSFSTPLVAGAVALLEQARPGTSYFQAEQSLQRAVPLTLDLGAGRLDINAAVTHRMLQP